MRILAVGDSYMHVDYFRAALSVFETAHEVCYLQMEESTGFVPTTESELRLSEYQGSPAALAAHMAGVEVLLVQGAPVTEEVIAAADRLRLVGCARGGPSNIDVQALDRQHLPLVNTPGKNADAVADQTLAFMVMLARGFPKAQQFLADGGRLVDNWQGAQFMGHDLGGHVLGLVGYGQVGRRVAMRAAAFGMRIHVFDPYFANHGEVDVERVERLGDLLAGARFVSVHARATAGNVRMFDATAFAAMASGSYFINTARDTLVDEEALDAALASGHLGGAALDVFETGEGPAEPHRLLRHSNVVLTPHIGGATHETLARGAEMLASELAAFVEGRPLNHLLNRR